MSKCHDWRQRYGNAIGHDALIPRDRRPELCDKETIVTFFAERPPQGRRLTYMVLDAGVA